MDEQHGAIPNPDRGRSELQNCIIEAMHSRRSTQPHVKMMGNSLVVRDSFDSGMRRVDDSCFAAVVFASPPPLLAGVAAPLAGALPPELPRAAAAAAGVSGPRGAGCFRGRPGFRGCDAGVPANARAAAAGLTAATGAVCREGLRREPAATPAGVSGVPNRPGGTGGGCGAGCDGSSSQLAGRGVRRSAACSCTAATASCRASCARRTCSSGILNCET